MGSQFEDLRKLTECFLIAPQATKNHLQERMHELLRYQAELEEKSIDLLGIQTQLETLRCNYAQLYHMAPIGYFTINAQGLISEANAAGSELLGISKSLLINKALARYLAPESQDIFSKYRNRAFEKNILGGCELKFMKRGSSLFYAKVNGTLITDERDHEKKLVLMISGSSPQKSKKEAAPPQIKQALSPSEPSSVLAHELNHPLGVISNYIHGCIRRLEGQEPDKETLLKAMTGAAQQLNHASEIILRMKNVNCKESLDYQPVCIDTLIKEVISLINPEIHDSSIQICYKKNKILSKIMMDKIHVQQVILNLARNAIDAMRDAKTEKPKLTIEANQASKGRIEICVLDNGPGFCLESSHKLFDPHFTTKPYGIGLGLAISRKIIEAHGGSLFAEQDAISGSCFKFTLPIRAS